jgi:hypothetical protein
MQKLHTNSYQPQCHPSCFSCPALRLSTCTNLPQNSELLSAAWVAGNNSLVYTCRACIPMHLSGWWYQRSAVVRLFHCMQRLRTNSATNRYHSSKSIASFTSQGGGTITHTSTALLFGCLHAPTCHRTQEPASPRTSQGGGTSSPA